MSAEKGPRGLEALNLMGLRLGEVLGGLKDAAEKIAEASGKEGVKTSVDIRVRSLDEALGERAAETAPRPHAPPKPAAPEAREPLVDAFDEPEAFVVTVELPGVAESEIALTPEPAGLIIETTGARRYRAGAALPEGLDLDRLERRLANGILEIRIPKLGSPA